jgi:hypothetical protein
VVNLSNHQRTLANHATSTNLPKIVTNRLLGEALRPKIARISRANKDLKPVARQRHCEALQKSKPKRKL